jgi:hypothetical protein
MLSFLGASFDMLDASYTWVDGVYRAAPAAAEAALIQSTALQLYWTTALPDARNR